ncbi:MAG: hypothetical protein ACFFC7_33400 [Candidatus Hermodarchaeota archaeon]
MQYEKCGIKLFAHKKDKTCPGLAYILTEISMTTETDYERSSDVEMYCPDHVPT